MKMARLTIKPKIYTIGSDSSAAERIIAECRVLNSGREYVFLQKRLDLLRSVQDVCEEIKSREKSINLLMPSAGLYSGPKLTVSTLLVTSKGIPRLFSLHFYGRTHAIFPNIIM